MKTRNRSTTGKFISLPSTPNNDIYEGHFEKDEVTQLQQNNYSITAKRNAGGTVLQIPIPQTGMSFMKIFIILVVKFLNKYRL